MKKLKDFIKTSVLGGILVILPVAILIYAFKWIFDLVTDTIQPLTDIVIYHYNFSEILSDLLVVTIIFLTCFLIGVIIKHRFGKSLYEAIENRLLRIAPGYTAIKETLILFFGTKKTFFSSVALVQIFANDTLATAFVTDIHPDGSYTVFVPTGPNPTSGNIFHLKSKYVHHVDITVEEAMRTIISCGAGSDNIFKSYLSKNKDLPGEK